VGEDFRRDPRRRLTIAQAADQLGISVDAMRARVKRRTVATHREGGRVYVLLDAAQDAAQDTTQTDRTAELIATLREQLAEEREARRRADTIIAQLARTTEEQARTIRELEAPSEPSDAAETAEEEPSEAGAEPRPATGGAQEGAQRRSWWRRLLGEGR